MRKVFLAAITLILFAQSSAFAVNLAEKVLEADEIVMRDDYRIIVNGVETKPDVPPMQKGGMIFIPLRYAAEALKAEVEWNDADKTVRLTFPGGKVVEMKVGDTEIAVEGGRKYIPYAPFIFEGRTMLPLKPTAESGIYIVDEKPDSMVITTGEENIKGMSTSDEKTNETDDGKISQDEAMSHIREKAQNDQITKRLKPYVQIAWALASLLWVVMAAVSASKGREDGWKDMIIIFFILSVGVLLITNFMYSTWWAALVAIGTCVVGTLSTENYSDKLVTMASTAQGIGLICTLFGLGLLIGPAIANRDISAIGYGIYVKIEPTITGLTISLLLNLLYGMEAKKLSLKKND